MLLLLRSLVDEAPQQLVNVTESWVGSGNVNGKAPTTGGGTWAVLGATTNFVAGYAASSGGNSVVLHSAAFADGTISAAEIVPGQIGAGGDAPLSLIGRATALSADTCYRVVFSVAGTPSVTLYKILSGASTQLASVDLYVQGVSASLSIVGSTITVSVASIAIITVNDTSIPGPGYWGFGNSWGESGEEFGNSSIGALNLVEEQAEPTSVAFPGFEVDIEPALWWQRKPKAEPVEQARAKVRAVAKVVSQAAQEHVDERASRARRKADVRDRLAPLVQDMPGFDWVAMYDRAYSTLLALEIRRQMDEAELIARREIERIQAAARDEDDIVALLLAI